MHRLRAQAYNAEADYHAANDKPRLAEFYRAQAAIQADLADETDAEAQKEAA